MHLLDNPDSLIIIDSGDFDSDLNRIALIGADMIITICRVEASILGIDGVRLAICKQPSF